MASIRELRAKFSASAEGFRQSINQIGQGLNQVTQQSQRTTQVMNTGWNNVFSTMAKIGGAYLGFNAVTSAVGGVVSATDQYQSSLISLQSQTGATDQQMQGMSGSLKSIYAGGYGQDFNDIAQAMATVGQNTGLTGKQLEGTTKNALSLRDTFGFEIPESTRTADTMMKQFGITSDQAMELMAQGAQSGLDKSGDMMDSFNEYSVYFKSLGYDAEGMWNVFKAGADGGAFNMDKVGDAVKEFNIRAKDGSKSTSQAYQALGLDADKMAQMIAKGGPSAQKAMAQTFEALGKIKDPVERNTQGVKLFGTQFEDLEVKTIQALGNIGNSADMNGNRLKKINEIKFNSLGSAFEYVKRQIVVGLLDPIQKQVMPMINQFVNFIRSNMPAISSAITGAFSGIAGIVGKLAPTFMNLFTILMNVGATVGPVIAGAIGGILAVLAPLANAITGVVASFTSWSGFAPLIYGVATAIAVYNAGVIAMNIYTKIMVATTKAWAIAQRMLNLAMAMNPIGLLVAVLIGLGVAFVTAYQKSETFRNFVNNLWTSIKTLGSNLMSWGAGVLSSLGGFFAGLGPAIMGWLSTAFSAVVSFFQTWGLTILAVITGPIGMLVALIITHWSQIKSFTVSAWQGIITAVQTAWAGFTAWISSAVSAVVSFFSSAWSGLVSIVTSVWSTIVTAVSTAFSGLISVITTIWTTIVTYVTTAVNTFVNNVKLAFSNFVSNISFIFSPLVGFFTNTWNNIKLIVLGIVGAFLNAITGNFTGFKISLLAIWTGIKSQIQNVVTTIAQVATNAFTVLKSGVLNIFNAIKSGATTAWNGLKSAVVNTTNAIKSGAMNAWNALKSGVINAVNATKSGAVNAWNALKSGVINAVNATKSGAINAWNALKSGVINAVNATKSGAINAWNALKSSVINAVNAIKSGAINGFNALKSGAVNAVNALKSGVISAFNALKSGAISAVNNIKSGIVNAFNSAKSLAVSAFNAMKSAIISTIHGIVSAVTGLKTKIVSTLKGINLASVGRQVIQGFINGIKSMAGAVGSAIKSVAGNVTKKIKGELGIHSPSRVFMEIGAFTGEGLAIGISDMEDRVARATAGLADASFGVINSEEVNPIKGKVQPGQSGQTGEQTNYNAPLMNIENYYQNTDTDVSSLSNGLFNLDRKSKRKKGK